MSTAILPRVESGVTRPREQPPHSHGGTNWLGDAAFLLMPETPEARRPE